VEEDHRAVQVREMWRAYARGGVDAMLACVDDDVEWMPFAAGGRVLHGSEELRDYHAGLTGRGERHEPTVYAVEAHGDAIVLTGALRVLRDGRLIESQIAWVYSFSGERLASAAGYGSRAEALRAIAALA
jgi:ketosteroid isomerase-like protein